MDKPVSAEDAILRVMNKLRKAEEDIEQAIGSTSDLPGVTIEAREINGLYVTTTAEAYEQFAAALVTLADAFSAVRQGHKILKDIAEKNSLPLPPVVLGGGGGDKP